MFGFTIIFPYIPTPSFSSSSSSSSSYYYYYYYYYYSYSSSCSRLITQEPTVKSVAPSMAAGKPTAKPSTAIPTYKPTYSPYDIITTFAGGGGGGGDGIPATYAYLSYPYGVAVDIFGIVFIADYFDNKIRMISSSGIITTFAGTGMSGSSGDGGEATSAQLSLPMGASADSSGKVYIADSGNHKIRMVSSTGIITTFAGTGSIGSNGDGGAATSAKFSSPTGVSADNSGNVYIIDYGNQKIRMVTSTGIITTVAGTGWWGSSGDGGAATSAQLFDPYGVAADISGNVYIADRGDNKIRMVSSAGIITTIAGTGTRGISGDGGAATSAQLCEPFGVAVDISGNVYVADYWNHKIRMVSSTGIITTFAGTGTAGSSGDGGAATSARLYYPFGVAADGNGQLVYIADSQNQKIRMVTRGLPIPRPSFSPASNQPAQVPFALLRFFLSFIFTLFNLSSFCIYSHIPTPLTFPRHSDSFFFSLRSAGTYS